MSGHSKWATTHRQKAVVDAKRGAIFTKLGNMIAIAARGGTDPAMNPSLALAIEKAKQANMPAANIERAIARVADKNSAALEEVVYEAYGPAGIGIIIETATDNKNRTFPEVKTALAKNGGTIAEPGSVAFQFDHQGIIRINLNENAKLGSADDILLMVLDAGAKDAINEDGEIIAISDMKEFHATRDAIKQSGIKISDAELQYVGKNQIEITDEQIREKLNKLLDALDDLDDVTNVWHNAEI